MYLVRDVVVGELRIQAYMVYFALSSPDVVVSVHKVKISVTTPRIYAQSFIRSERNIELIAKFAVHDVHACRVYATLLLQQIIHRSCRSEQDQGLGSELKRDHRPIWNLS